MPNRLISQELETQDGIIPCESHFLVIFAISVSPRSASSFLFCRVLLRACSIWVAAEDGLVDRFGRMVPPKMGEMRGTP